MSRPVVKPCGTYAAYKRHINNNQEPCEPCKDAMRQYTRTRGRARRKSKIMELNVDHALWLMGLGPRNVDDPLESYYGFYWNDPQGQWIKPKWNKAYIQHWIGEITPTVRALWPD